MTLAPLAVFSLVMLAVRLYAAAHTGFGDSEALYAAYALHPQPAYLDHPGLIGVFASVIGGAGAPTPQAAHAVTAGLATLAPWCVVVSARAMGASLRPAMHAAFAVAVVPEIAVGLFAMTPDLLLFFAWVLAVGLAATGLLARPSSTRAAASFVGAGLLAGIAAASKITGAVLLVALVAAYLGRGARAHARTPWPWAGLSLGLLVVWPVVSFEARTGWPMLRHRLIDTQHDAGLSLRNAAALGLGQLVYLSPLVAVAAVLVARELFRGRKDDVVSALAAWTVFLPLAVLVPLCLWSRVAEPHWIAPALLALPLYHALRPHLARRFALATVGTAALLSGAAYAWVLVPKLVDVVPAATYDPRLDLANELTGWPEVVATVRKVVAEQRVPGDATGDVVVVGPHWIVCAQLDAALGREVPVGCAGGARDDFADWNPPSRWRQAGVVVFVSDNRFAIDPLAIFPDRVKSGERRVTILRGGHVARVFTVDVLAARAQG